MPAEWQGHPAWTARKRAAMQRQSCAPERQDCRRTGQAQVGCLHAPCHRCLSHVRWQLWLLQSSREAARTYEDVSLLCRCNAVLQGWGLRL